MTIATDPRLKVRDDDLRATARRWLQAFDRLLSGRWWLAVVVGLAFATSIVASAPDYSQFDPQDASWQAIEHNASHPFDQSGLDPVKDRAYNFTFRVTVPLVGGVLGLSPAGYLVLQGLSGLGLFAAAALVAQRITGSRRLAALTAISTGLMWAGACAFIEVHANFDAVAIALLVAAMATRRPPLIALCTFLAAWTDERAIPIVAFVALYHHVAESTNLTWPRALTLPQVWGAAAGVAIHVVTRIVASSAFDIHQPSNLGASYIKEQTSILPVGMWTGLEGLWVFVALAGLLLWKRRAYTLDVAYLGAIAAFAVLAIGVVDVTRSMAYLLPAGLAGMAVVARLGSHRLVRVATYAAFTLTALWPMYYAGCVHPLLALPAPAGAPSEPRWPVLSRPRQVARSIAIRVGDRRVVTRNGTSFVVPATQVRTASKSPVRTRSVSSWAWPSVEMRFGPS
ncbi:MAG: hypothetical protein R2701_06875 [Acidimicrobiales bacterium]